MSGTTRRVVVEGSAVAVAALALLGAAAGPASADHLTGRDYARHVVEHNTSFSGTHNPGVMHQGFSGWEEHMEHHHG